MTRAVREVPAWLALVTALVGCANPAHPPVHAEPEPTVSPGGSASTPTPAETAATTEPAEHPCRGLDQSSCKASSACYVVTGARLEKDAGGTSCWNAGEYMGCIVQPEACGDGFTMACRDGGDVFMVSDTCITEGPGWTECTQANSDLLDAPRCSPS